MTNKKKPCPYVKPPWRGERKKIKKDRNKVCENLSFNSYKTLLKKVHWYASETSSVYK